jgi:hypothetical protein
MAGGGVCGRWSINSPGLMPAVPLLPLIPVPLNPRPGRAPLRPPTPWVVPKPPPAWAPPKPPPTWPPPPPRAKASEAASPAQSAAAKAAATIILRVMATSLDALRASIAAALVRTDRLEGEQSDRSIKREPNREASRFLSRSCRCFLSLRLSDDGPSKTREPEVSGSTELTICASVSFMCLLVRRQVLTTSSV